MKWMTGMLRISIFQKYKNKVFNEKSRLEILHGLGENQGISRETPYFSPMAYFESDAIR